MVKSSKRKTRVNRRKTRVNRRKTRVNRRKTRVNRKKTRVNRKKTKKIMTGGMDPPSKNTLDQIMSNYFEEIKDEHFNKDKLRIIEKYMAQVTKLHNDIIGTAKNCRKIRTKFEIVRENVIEAIQRGEIDDGEPALTQLIPPESLPVTGYGAPIISLPERQQQAPLERQSSATAVENWLNSIGLGSYAQNASQSSNFHNIEDFNINTSSEEFTECLRQLEIDNESDIEILRDNINRRTYNSFH